MKKLILALALLCINLASASSPDEITIGDISLELQYCQALAEQVNYKTERHIIHKLKSRLATVRAFAQYMELSVTVREIDNLARTIRQNCITPEQIATVYNENSSYNPMSSRSSSPLLFEVEGCVHRSTVPEDQADVVDSSSAEDQIYKLDME